jgi:hypothetical protein
MHIHLHTSTKGKAIQDDLEVDVKTDLTSEQVLKNPVLVKEEVILHKFSFI